MRRSFRYGLYGVVLAGVVGGSVAWANVDKTVTLRVDGESNKIHTVASTVKGVLGDAGYQVGGHDIVAPAVTAPVSDGAQVVLKRGRLLHLVVDGKKVDIWTTAASVDEALNQLGYSTADFSSVSRDRRLPLSPTDLELRTPKSVSVVADGKTRSVITTDATVAQVLRDLRITVGAKDRLSVAATSAPVSRQRIVLQRVKEVRVVEQKVLPFATIKQNDPNAYQGTTTVVTEGKAGVAKVTWAVVYVDGKVAGRVAVGTTVLTPAVAKLIKVGTKALPDSSTYAGSISVDPNTAQGIAKSMLAQRGWGDDQFSCLLQIWNRESGWRVDAQNASSGAYGIPQALPGSKMATVAADWQTNPATQITWGLGYISGRYGTPCGAWDFWQAHNWY
ncbi:MAG: ubiquitin-like domain-containing protein [Actinomycetota bacterium]